MTQKVKKGSTEEISWEDIAFQLNKRKEIFSQLIPVAMDEAQLLKTKEKILATAILFMRPFILVENRERLLLPVLAPIEAKIKASDSDAEVFELFDEMEKVSEKVEKEFYATLTDDFVREDERFKKYKKEMEKIFKEFKGTAPAPEEEDEEDITTEEELENDVTSYVPILDPFTKGPLLEPVKNIHCNHFYGKESVYAMIGAPGRKNIKCPYAGCENARPLRTKDLVVDQEMNVKISAKQGGGSRH